MNLVKTDEKWSNFQIQKIGLFKNNETYKQSKVHAYSQTNHSETNLAK